MMVNATKINKNLITTKLRTQNVYRLNVFTINMIKFPDPMITRLGLDASGFIL